MVITKKATQPYKSYYLLNMNMFGTDFFGFQIIFKCMSGSTTENGKFIVPLTEKLTYPKSSDRCDSQGLTRFLLPIMVYLQSSEIELNQMDHLR